MVCTLTVAILALGGCGEPPSPSDPEVELRAWVAAGMEAARNKEREELVDMISASYVDARGNERDDIGNMLRLYFLRMSNIKLASSIDEIIVYDNTAAEIIMSVGMAGTSGGTLGFSADAYRFELELEKDSDDWQLIAARWGELGHDLH